MNNFGLGIFLKSFSIPHRQIMEKETNEATERPQKTDEICKLIEVQKFVDIPMLSLLDMFIYDSEKRALL